MLNLIAAVSTNGVIGVDNKLPWHIPADLRYFKKMTTNHTIVMGRKTFESIGKPLPSRTNIVLTKDTTFRHDGVLVTHDFNTIFDLPGEVFIIGGESLYSLYLPHAHKLYITRVHSIVKGDTYFPYLPNHFDLKSYNYMKSDDENNYDITFCVYENIYKK